MNLSWWVIHMIKKKVCAYLFYIKYLWLLHIQTNYGALNASQ